MNDYTELKKLINGWIETETLNAAGAKDLFGENSPVYNQDIGAINAYKQVLRDIEFLEGIENSTSLQKEK